MDGLYTELAGSQFYRSGAPQWRGTWGYRIQMSGKSDQNGRSAVGHLFSDRLLATIASEISGLATDAGKKYRLVTGFLWVEMIESGNNRSHQSAIRHKHLHITA